MKLVKSNRSLIDNFFDDAWFSPMFSKAYQSNALPVNITTDKEKVIIEAEVAGIDPKNVDISVDNGTLTIKGEKKYENRNENKQYICAERYEGSFSRSFSLPDYVDASKILANYDKGILTITIPKREVLQPKRIEISTA